ncbi:hypothetical protein ACJIZ3_017943 [Penstemon smallii]|uniref:Dirigent protein n=1 Tax=Penstemon smallii TaxID=265156 RepID=A0ABD3SXJ5_9LAMI
MGIVSNPATGGQVPFAKPNGVVSPSTTEFLLTMPTMNDNDIPFLTGLSGFTSNVGQNNIIGGMPGFPVLNSAQFPSGTTLQKLVFGTMTVFDDESTEGHDIGSGLVGKAQGFYISSSEDGTSQTIYVDSLSFFGVHWMAVAESHLYVNVKGFAVVKTFAVGNNQQETDGMETLLQISVYLGY